MGEQRGPAGMPARVPCFLSSQEERRSPSVIHPQLKRRLTFPVSTLPLSRFQYVCSKGAEAPSWEAFCRRGRLRQLRKRGRLWATTEYRWRPPVTPPPALKQGHWGPPSRPRYSEQVCSGFHPEPDSDLEPACILPESISTLKIGPITPSSWNWPLVPWDPVTGEDLSSEPVTAGMYYSPRRELGPFRVTWAGGGTSAVSPAPSAWLARRLSPAASAEMWVKSGLAQTVSNPFSRWNEPSLDVDPACHTCHLGPTSASFWLFSHVRAS